VLGSAMERKKYGNKEEEEWLWRLYYLDYQNRRPDYLTAFVEDLINWDFVDTLLA
jgi:hypothetical protein